MSVLISTQTISRKVSNDGAADGWFDIPGGLQGFRRLKVYGGGSPFQIRDASVNRQDDPSEYQVYSQFDSEGYYFQPGCQMQVYLTVSQVATIEISRLMLVGTRFEDKSVIKIRELLE